MHIPTLHKCLQGRRLLVDEKRVARPGIGSPYLVRTCQSPHVSGGVINSGTTFKPLIIHTSGTGRSSFTQKSQRWIDRSKSSCSQNRLHAVLNTPPWNIDYRLLNVPPSRRMVAGIDCYESYKPECKSIINEVPVGY